MIDYIIRFTLLYNQAAVRMFRFLQAGMTLRG